jgi:hypothetical protein
MSSWCDALNSRRALNLRDKILIQDISKRVGKLERVPRRLPSKNIIIRIHKTIILPMVLYGCGTCSLESRENRVLSRIFGPKRGEGTGGWRKLHNEDLHNFYYSPNINRMIKSRRMRWAVHVVRNETKKKNDYGIFVGKPEGERQLGRPGRMRVDKIKMEFRVIGWGDTG